MERTEIESAKKAMDKTCLEYKNQFADLWLRFTMETGLEIYQIGFSWEFKKDFDPETIEISLRSK